MKQPARACPDEAPPHRESIPISRYSVSSDVLVYIDLLQFPSGSVDTLQR